MLADKENHNKSKISKPKRKKNNKTKQNKKTIGGNKTSWKSLEQIQPSGTIIIIIIIKYMQ